MILDFFRRIWDPQLSCKCPDKSTHKPIIVCIDFLIWKIILVSELILRSCSVKQSMCGIQLLELDATSSISSNNLIDSSIVYVPVWAGQSSLSKIRSFLCLSGAPYKTQCWKTFVFTLHPFGSLGPMTKFFPFSDFCRFPTFWKPLNPKPQPLPLTLNPKP